ncbi:endonuclease/exonuclease/phosphatase family protein [Actinopolymorpha singaporensis]|uniref:Metal-dependent hydrolase, endonuclease/exonuclease/phosphatase family n=1 Tax=Actinopolymorpha singaporensis TaxID=117157 RepID=A0A1H1TEU1_9ACTN|nr:endonuclease/exonuclease/phosphatase family protein [Actinopolymorpha singaporensis]SDS58708.1 Metal-dependent hydrolase, endonuclease/exonuclease/phosphatase family [Actinopolymorpha singaporensis]
MRPRSPEHLRLATLNVWGTRGDWPPRRERLAAGFAELAPDLLTLQETIVTDTYDQVRDVLGDEYLLVHQTAREDDGQGITTASRWPVGQVIEVDLQINDRTAGFACTSLVTEVLAPEPFGRIWLVNHFPSWRLDLEHERCLQTVRTAGLVERLAAERPGHVIVAGDLDADPDATSIRFWTGRHPLDGMSVCYRDAWASARDHFGVAVDLSVASRP